IPAKKSSSVSPASTPTASAGNTPSVSPRPSTGRSSKSTGSISALRDTNSVDRHPSKLSSNAVSERFPQASNTQNSDIHDGLKLFDCPSTGIFSASSYDNDYHEPDISNQEKEILVNPVTTKKVNEAHPHSLIIGDLHTPVQTRKKAKAQFDMDTNKLAPTPFEPPKIKDKNLPDGPVNVHLYRSMIGSLMYLTASRPDITFAVSACARNQVSPTVTNLNAVKRIFKYIKGHPKLGLWYLRDSPFDLEAFSNSDYAGAAGDRKSTTGGCQFMGRRLISWQCKKQTIVATSSCEAEYVAVASCCGQ
nr:uncharacterized mitochondrial protein AtMg00810-like [Tanacetum cinerariifolium]